MSGITGSIQNTASFHTSSCFPRSDEAFTSDHARPPTSYKSGLKAAMLGTAALVGTVVTYWAYRYLGSIDPIHADAMSKTEPDRLDISPRHGMVSERAVPIAVSLENQVAMPGSLFEVSHQFFTQANGGVIQQKIIQGPNWLTSQLDPIESGFWSYAGTASRVQVIGTTAYLADGTGLQIINITNSSNPILIGNYSGLVNAVQVIGTTAYLAGKGLQIIDITNFSSPILIGNYTTLNHATGVQVVGTTAYLAAGTNFTIINVATPSVPTLIGSYKPPYGYVSGVQVVGNTAFLSAGRDSLMTLDITNPMHPIWRGGYDAGFAYGLQVVGNIAYVVEGNGCNCLQIFNVTNPPNTTFIGNYFTSTWAYGVQVIGTLAFVVDEGGFLYIIDVSIPSTPALIGSYNHAYGYSIQVVGDTAYLGGENGGLRILSRLNRLKLSGYPDTIERMNYEVIIEGITPTGSTTTSFMLNVGGLLPPVYQNPISIQQATVDQSFNYVMLSNVFVDPNGYEMTYKAKGLPKWLTFDAGKSLFSGKPTSEDTATFGDQSTTVTVIASDGIFETEGQFTVIVTGDSYFGKILKIGGPILSVLGTLYSGYKNRALLLDQIAKRKWKNNQRSVKLGENFIYVLKTNAKDVRKIQAYVKDKGCLGKTSQKILCGKQRYVEVALRLPVWMRYNTEVNALHSIRKLEETDLLDCQNMQIRVLGSGSVIQELLHLELDDVPPTLDGTFDSMARQERIGLLLPTTMDNFIQMEDLGNLNNDTNQMSVQV